MEIAKVILFALFVLFILALVALLPFGFIWSVNTIFATTIPYNISTWFASMFLVLLFGTKSSPISIKKEQKKCCKND